MAIFHGFIYTVDDVPMKKRLGFTKRLSNHRVLPHAPERQRCDHALRIGKNMWFTITKWWFCP
jgi:hypothetical protein